MKVISKLELFVFSIILLSQLYIADFPQLPPEQAVTISPLFNVK